MRHVGIICEYNPFHRGHAYLIGQVREAETVICLQSGNFTQRGEAALLPPIPRAAMALAAGADLVLELPFPYSAASAQYFATAGVRGLAGVGADTLAFGSECGDPAVLQELSQRLPNGNFRKKAADGAENSGDAAAYFAALGESPASNDILALAYLQAIRQEGHALSPCIVQRVGDGYRDEQVTHESFASATAIRNKLAAGEDVSEWIPCVSYPILEKVLSTYGMAKTAALGDLMLSELRKIFAEGCQTVSKKEEFAECGGGLLDRLCKAALQATDYTALCRLAATKRYTDGRIRRALLCLIAGVRREDLSPPPAYLRLLAANEKGRAFLAKTEKTRTVPVVTKQSEIAALGDAAARQRALGLIADGLFSICCGGRITLHELQTARPHLI